MRFHAGTCRQGAKGDSQNGTPLCLHYNARFLRNFGAYLVALLTQELLALLCTFEQGGQIALAPVWVESISPGIESV